MKTKTKIVVIVSGLVLAAGLYAGNKIYKIVTKPEVIVKEMQVSNGEKQIVLQEVDKQEVKKDLPMSLSEKQVLQEIHEMSHQKVSAEEKWGAIPMTQERIERLIVIVKKNKYYNDYIYLSILNRWAKGDFSHAIEDHNTIWEIQAGTVGKAGGLLAPEEEKQFIEQNFSQ